MKKQLLVALIGAALAVPFAAQAAGAYVGVNAGSAKQTATATFGNFGDASDTGYKLYGGYNFTQTFGIEGGYVDFGNVTISNGSSTVSSKSTAFYVAGTATLPLNDQFSLFAKLGVSANRADVIGTDGTVYPTQTKTSALIGVGAAYNINKNLSVVAEYENFGKVYEDPTGNLKADMYSVGLRYKF